MIPMSSTNALLPSSVPAFIAKLWHMVSDESCNDLISWSEDGSSFIISNQAKFCSHLLPRYYKHNNMASFIRQLNKYGFHKVSSIESSSLRSDKGDYEFAHEFFVKGCAKSLEMIKRKMTTNSREIVDIKGEMAPLLQQLLLQVQDLKDSHETFESKISTMKRENDALWREHSVLRQKYVKQQKMINQLIQFLVTLVQQTRGVNVNRARGVPIILKDFVQTPLMAIEAKKKDSPVIREVNLSDSNDHPSTKYIIKGEDPLASPSTNYLIDSPIDPTTIAEPRVMFATPDSPGEASTLEIPPSPSGVFDPPIIWCDDLSNSGIGTLGSPISAFNVNSPSSSKMTNLSVCPQDVTPPVITRRTTEPKNIDNGKDSKSNTAAANPRKVPAAVKQEKIDPVFNPLSDELDLDALPSESTTTCNQRKRKLKDVEPGSSLVLSDTGSRHDLENHLDVVQSDLDSLKDILQGLDTSAFMSLFNEQDPLGLNMTDGANKQQLVSISPAVIDMSDLLQDDEDDVLTVPSPIDTTAFDSLLNTPQPTPSAATEPNFLTPKRMKK